ncbi:MAG: glycosyltransferase family 2 protein [Verrucomicrobia bacterium]|nr:glycosyltransferase family 2 protein [Verrucomicrobiota bacterium]
MAFRPLQRQIPEWDRKQPKGCGPCSFRFMGYWHGFLAVETSHEPTHTSFPGGELNAATSNEAPPPGREQEPGAVQRFNARSSFGEFLPQTTDNLPQYQVSVIILNYQGAPWIERCLDSLRRQTLFAAAEIIVADNASTDGSDKLAEKLTQSWPNARVMQHGKNLGYCEGNNRAAQAARGQYLFFLNNDAWLEPDCLATLLAEVRSQRANAATPLVLNYDDNTVQPIWGAGFDVFGLPSFATRYDQSRDLFMPPGCCFLVEREWFERIGGFDKALFMYADELDLSWRLWIAGGRAIAVARARLHHHLAANVNPEGGRMSEVRTSATKRFYTNRNVLLVLLKNCRNVLLLLVPLQLALWIAEAFASLLLIRRGSFVRRAYVDALAECWRLRPHVLSERRRIGQFRRRGDFWMLRFLRWRLNRWEELRRVLRHGPPKVAGD